MRSAIALYLWLLGLVNLGLALIHTTSAQDRTITVWDPARECGQVVVAGGRATRLETAALKEALRVAFRWGRYRGQTPQRLKRFEAAYWEQLRLLPECYALRGLPISVDRILWGPNYAKVYLRGTRAALQVNFWGRERGPSSPWNPTGWRFRAKISLIAGRGLGL